MKTRTATIDSGGRGGNVYYQHGNTSLRFAWEYGATGFEIAVPPPDQWESQTGIPLENRQETLQFIANQIIAQKENANSQAKMNDSEYSFLIIEL